MSICSSAPPCHRPGRGSLFLLPGGGRRPLLPKHSRKGGREGGREGKNRPKIHTGMPAYVHFFLPLPLPPSLPPSYAHTGLSASGRPIMRPITSTGFPPGA